MKIVRLYTHADIRICYLQNNIITHMTSSNMIHEYIKQDIIMRPGILLKQQG